MQHKLPNSLHSIGGIPEGCRDVLAVIELDNFPDIRHFCIPDRFQEGHEIQQGVVTALQLPRLQLQRSTAMSAAFNNDPVAHECFDWLLLVCFEVRGASRMLLLLLLLLLLTCLLLLLSALLPL